MCFSEFVFVLEFDIILTSLVISRQSVQQLKFSRLSHTISDTTFFISHCVPFTHASVRNSMQKMAADIESGSTRSQIRYANQWTIGLVSLPIHVRKVVGGFGKKVVVLLMWENQGIHVCHWPPWYDLCCWSGVKLQYNQIKPFCH